MAAEGSVLGLAFAKPWASAVLCTYLLCVLVLGWLAARRGRGDVSDFVAGERAFGPVVMYFVVGATMFSAYALLGTPQRVVEKGSDVFYILAYGSVGLVPLFFVGARVRRLGARHGFVTQAELVAARFDSRAVALLMAIGTLAAFWPYLVIQLQAAAMVVSWATGWTSPVWGAGLVAAVVCTYVVQGGVRGVGWTNVVQGVGMLVVVWVIGLYLPQRLYGGVGPMFDRVAAEKAAWLVLPEVGETGPGGTSPWSYSSQVLVSALGFSVWPHVFMKCFTAKSARLVQWSVMTYPSFLFFLLPLIFLGYVATLEGGPATDQVLFWLAELPGLEGASTWIGAFLAFAVLAASMSTLDALLHASGAVLVRDLWVGGLGRKLDPSRQPAMMRVAIVVTAALAFMGVASGIELSLVDLLLLGYDFIVQFVPVIFIGLFWRGANRVGAVAGLSVGLLGVLVLQLVGIALPVRPGVLALLPNLAVFVLASRVGQADPEPVLARFFDGPPDAPKNSERSA